MRARSSVFLLFLSLAVAAGCIRLGVWQLARLAQRRARNREAIAQGTLPPLDLSAPGGRDSLAKYRRVQATGKFDFAHEVALSSRPHNGSPGVHIVTPLILNGTDTAVLVIRGWAYSANASAIDFARFREREDAHIEGYLLPFDSVAADTSSRTSMARLDYGKLERRGGRPLAAYYILMTGGGAAGDSTLVRLSAPALDEGPHMSYAIQWFLFATIFGAGGAFVAFRGSRAPSRFPSARGTS